MDIIKIKLQIFLVLIICFLGYRFITKDSAPAPETQMTMAEMEMKAAKAKGSGRLNQSAEAEAQRILQSGDISKLEEQMRSSGLF